jgi:hypothetical protein
VLRWLLLVTLSVGSVGCDATLAEYDNIYARGADHFVLCGMSIDDKNSVSVDEIGAALDRAQIDGTTLQLYSHNPQRTVEVSTIETVVAGAADRGMGFATYAALSEGEVPGSLALSFDDHDLAGWTTLRPIFDRYAAKVTFFVSAYGYLNDEQKAQLHDLEADGHDIEYHSTSHENAELYSQEHGVTAYMDDDILPGLELMRQDGYRPTIFAYPFGARTAATDEALRPYFAHLRAIRSTCPR